MTLLPHMGSATHEGRADMGEKVIINIRTFADGPRPPEHALGSSSRQPSRPVSALTKRISRKTLVIARMSGPAACRLGFCSGASEAGATNGGRVRRFRGAHRRLHGGGGGPDALGRRNGRRGKGDQQFRRNPSPRSWSNADSADQPVHAPHDGGICPRGLGAQGRALSVASSLHATGRRVRLRFHDAGGDGAQPLLPGASSSRAAARRFTAAPPRRYAMRTPSRKRSRITSPRPDSTTSRSNGGAGRATRRCAARPSRRRSPISARRSR